MLPGSHLIKSRRTLDKIKRIGKLYQQETFGALVVETNPDDNPKFGFVISTKISKLATQRNRIRRALQETIRQNMFYLRNGFNMVFLAKVSLASKTTEEIMKEVANFLREEKFIVTNNNNKL